MSLKKFDELTEDEKKQISYMYSDLTSQEQYLYNFDDNGKYVGRQYEPPAGETKEGLHFGRIRITKDESVKEDETIVEKRLNNFPPTEVKSKGKSKKK